jgi:hypothetical protein
MKNSLIFAFQFYLLSKDCSIFPLDKFIRITNLKKNNATNSIDMEA